MRTLADMTEEERAQCQGLWCEIDTPMGTELAIYDQLRWTKEPTLLEPEYGYFEADLSKVTPRPDLPRAWREDGQPPRTQYWTMEQAAEQWQISTRTLRRRIAEGRLTAYRAGRTIRLNPQDVDTLFTRVEPREMDEA